VKSESKESMEINKVAKGFRDLNVYKLAFDAAMIIFELSKMWPKEEKYSAVDQIRRSSRSVCANLAEAWRKRRYPAHFVSKLSDADSEAAETEVWLDFGFNCMYLEQQNYDLLKVQYDHIERMITKMIKSPEKWCEKAKK